MTNEEIFTLFLKKYRKFSYCKRNFKLGLSDYLNNYTDVGIDLAVDYLFIWSFTEQGDSYWSNISEEWEKLVSNFGLKGTINLEKVFK